MLKICKHLTVTLSKVSEKFGRYWSWYSDKNGAKDVSLGCNFIPNDWICFKFFGHLPCKSINKHTNFCCNQRSGSILNISLFGEICAGRKNPEKNHLTVSSRGALQMAHALVITIWRSEHSHFVTNYQTSYLLSFKYFLGESARAMPIYYWRVSLSIILWKEKHYINRHSSEHDQFLVMEGQRSLR